MAKEEQRRGPGKEPYNETAKKKVREISRGNAGHGGGRKGEKSHLLSSSCLSNGPRGGEDRA